MTKPTNHVNYSYLFSRLEEIAKFGNEKYEGKIQPSVDENGNLIAVEKGWFNNFFIDVQSLQTETSEIEREINLIFKDKDISVGQFQRTIEKIEGAITGLSYLQKSDASKEKEMKVVYDAFLNCQEKLMLGEKKIEQEEMKKTKDQLQDAKIRINELLKQNIHLIRDLNHFKKEDENNKKEINECRDFFNIVEKKCSSFNELELENEKSKCQIAKLMDQIDILKTENCILEGKIKYLQSQIEQLNHSIEIREWLNEKPNGNGNHKKFFQKGNSSSGKSSKS